MDLNSHSQSDDRLRGVGGWLIILILGLTFVSPYWQFRIGVHAFETLLSPKPLTQAFIFRLSIMLAIYGGLAVFSFICGTLLWRSNRRAPTVTKAYFIVSVSLVVVLYVTYRLVGLEFDLFRTLFPRVIYVCGWYAYLEFSKRVRLTYAREDDVTPVPSPSSPATA